METTLAAPTARDGEAAKTHAASEAPEPEPQSDTGGVTPLPDQDASDAPADPLTTLSRRTGCTVEWLEALGLRNDRRRCIERLCGRKVIHDAVRIPLVDPLTGEEVSHQHWIPCRHPHKPGRHDDLAAAGKQWGELAPVLAAGLGSNRQAVVTEGATDTFRLLRLIEADGAPLSVLGLPGVSNAKNLAKRLAEEEAVEDLILALDNDAAGNLCRDEAIREWLKHRTGNQTISFITDLAERADLCSHAEENGDAGVLDLFDGLLEAVPLADDAADDTRRSKQRRNMKARSSAIDRVHDDGRVIYLDGRIWEHIDHVGWLHLPDEIARARIVTELAKDLGVSEQGVTPRLTSDTLQSFKDVCQPDGAAQILRLTSGEAATLKTGQPVLGTPWLDVMLHVNSRGAVQVMRRDIEIWSPRPPVPAEWGDGAYERPERTLAFLRSATTAADEDPTSAEAWHRAEWLMSGVGQILCEHVDAQKIWCLTGAGGRGKGTFQRLLTGLVGGASFGVTGPAGMADRFALSALETKRILIVTDAPETDLTNRDYAQGVGHFKAVSGGDEIKFERKFLGAVSRRLRVIIVVASNDVPAWAGSAKDFDAWERRLHIVEFNGPKPRPPVANLEHGLLRGDGLNNIARYAVECRRRVLTGDLTEPADLVDLRRSILADGVAPLDRWAVARLTKTRQPSTSLDDLAADYRAWAERQDLDDDDINATTANVGRALKTAFPTVRRKRQRVPGTPNARRSFYSVRITEPESVTEDRTVPDVPRYVVPVDKPPARRTSEGDLENIGHIGHSDDPERLTAEARQMIFGSTQPPQGAHGGEF